MVKILSESRKEVTLEQTVEDMLSRKTFFGVERLKYLPYRLDTALSVFHRIGLEKSKSFTIDRANIWVFQQLVRWAHGDKFECHNPESDRKQPQKMLGDPNKGIYIAGKTGTGKSWALDILSAYCEVDDMRVRLGKNVHRLSYECFRTDSICEIYSETGTIQRFKQRGVICFQDLGTEPLESLYMGNRISVMQQILESRGDRNDLITLISSNEPMLDLHIKYGDRVESRIKGMCNYLILNGEDRR
jgi:hypothetical protein